MVYVKVRTPATQLLLDNREPGEPNVDSKYLGTRTRASSASPRCYQRENVRNLKNCDTTSATYTNTDCNSGTVLGRSTQMHSIAGIQSDTSDKYSAGVHESPPLKTREFQWHGSQRQPLEKRRIVLSQEGKNWMYSNIGGRSEWIF